MTAFDAGTGGDVAGTDGFMPCSTDGVRGFEMVKRGAELTGVGNEGDAVGLSTSITSLASCFLGWSTSITSMGGCFMADEVPPAAVVQPTSLRADCIAGGKRKLK